MSPDIIRVLISIKAKTVLAVKLYNFEYPIESANSVPALTRLFNTFFKPLSEPLKGFNREKIKESIVRPPKPHKSDMSFLVLNYEEF